MMTDIRVTKDGGKIWTAKYIPKNSYFGPYERNLVELARTTDEKDTEFSLREKELDESKQIDTQQQNWLCLIKCARKADEQNLEAIRAPNEMIYVRTTRDISPGEVLGVWFSTSLAKQMGIKEAEEDNKPSNSWLCAHCCRSFKYQRTLLVHKRFDCCKPSSKGRSSAPRNTDHPVTSENEEVKPMTIKDTQSNLEDNKSSFENSEDSSNSELSSQKITLDEARRRQDSDSAEPKKRSPSHETEILDVKKFLLKGTFATPFQYKMNADIESKCNEVLQGLKEHLTNTAVRENEFLTNMEPMGEQRSSTSLPCLGASVATIGHDHHVSQKSKFSSLLTLLSSRPRPSKSMEEKSLAEFHKKEFRKKFQGNEQYLRKHLYRSRARRSDAPLSQQKLTAFTTHFTTSSLFRFNSGAQFPFPESFKEERESALHRYSGTINKYPFFSPVVTPQKSLEYSQQIDKSTFHCFSQPALRPQTSRVSEPIRCEDYLKYNITLHRSAFGPYISSRKKRHSTDPKLFQDSNEKHGDTVSNIETEDFLKRSRTMENKEDQVDPPTGKTLKSTDGCFFLETSLRPSAPVDLFKNREELISDDDNTADRKSPKENEFDSSTNQVIYKSLSSPTDLKSNYYSKPGLVQYIPKTFNNEKEICYHDSSAHAQLHEQSRQDIPRPDDNTPKDNIHLDFKTLPLPNLIHSYMPRPQLLPLMTPRIVSHVPSTPSRDQGFMCEFCGKVYCRKYVLKIHMRTHTGFKPLHCKVCDKSFSDPSNMKKHVKLHETEHTVHKCKHCGRNFVRYRGLLNHIKAKHSPPSSFGYY